ncbi:MAG: Rrf2 family transcriptional regulator [Deinococcota bacterium]
MYRTLLKREESYAVHALINIAEHPGTNAAQIATDLKMPPAFMAKVLRKLVAANFIDSKMGRGGGVFLKIDPKATSLLDIVEAISGTVILDTCQTQQHCATQLRQGHCRLKLAWLGASQAIRTVLSGVMLAQIYDEPVT